LGFVYNGIVDPTLPFMSDEASFHLSGFVNAQNIRHWDTENPHAVYYVPLHGQKVGVWCAVSGRRVTGPIFHYDTVNSERYVNNMSEPFFQILNEEENQQTCSQQDNAAAHTSHFLGLLREMFGVSIFWWCLWPHRSRDTSLRDFCLCVT
jgi:hypothetical protein